jgi:hypothetical protein
MEWRSYIARYGTHWLPGERWARWCFLALWALAAVLRFWDLPHLAYTHDELSALVRIYPTLSETIGTGVVKLDTHPPGVQVFEWGWTKLFSREEADVKLPFILMGLTAMLLLYRFAMAWTGAGTALFLTALMAVLQYFVLYSQLARPYAAGLFTTALLADQLTRYLALGQRKALVGAGLAAVLSAYTHHFALMLATFMVISFLFLVRADQRKAYLVMCLGAALLYLPNVSIFLKQLDLGGLSEWLAPPTKAWIPDHLWWVAHGSTALAAILLVIVLVSTGLRWRLGGAYGPARWFLPVWGLLPLIIGLAYSVWRAPVIQHSVLMFSFPYLVLTFSAGLRHLPRWATLVMVGLLSVVGVRTLVTDRAHYDLLYHSKYEVFVRKGMEQVSARSPDSVAVLIDAPDHMIRFYLEQLHVAPDSLPYVQLQDAYSDDRLDSLLSTLSQSYLFLGWSNGAPSERVARAQHHFPHLIERHDLNEGQWVLLARNRPGQELQDKRIVATADPLTRTGNGWDIATDLAVHRLGPDSLAHWDLSGREYGVVLECLLDTLVAHPQDLVEVVCEVRSDRVASDIGFVAQLLSGDSTVFYRTGEVGNMLSGGRSASLVVVTRRSDAGSVHGPIRLKTYIYNRRKDPLHIRRVTVSVRHHNTVQFGLVEPFERPWRYPIE